MILLSPHSHRLLKLAVLQLFVCSSLVAQVQMSKESLVRSLNAEKLQHPYLFFDAEGKKALLKRIETDKDCRNIMAGLVAEGHRLLSVPLKDSAPVSPKHPRFESTDEGSAYVGEITQGAQTLAFLYQMTGEVAYAKKAIEFAMAVCDLETWVNPAHKFDIIYPRVWPWNVPDDRVVFTYDITASGRAISMATVYDWVYPVMTKAERDKIRSGLLEKAITRVRGNYDYFWWSSAYRCNWSAICYSGLAITAFSLMKEDPQILDVVAEAYNRINLTFDQIGVDGGWQEGRGYYGYMMRVSVMFMDALKRLSGGKFDLFAHEKVKKHPFDFFLYGLTANFEDSEGSPIGPSSVVDRIVQETGNTTGAWYRKQFVRDGDEMFDIIWPKSTVTPVEPEQKSMLFRSINWAILRSDFVDRSTFTIACKAGLNDDPHHGHLDCGQFILTWQGIPFIRDIGRMRYDELYFNEDRWLYPYASSAGHNLVYVNGEQQLPAKLKDQPWKEGIGGKVVDFKTAPKRDYVIMDPTHAYPGKELKKWRRNIVLEKPTLALIVDEVGAKAGSKIQARFFPGVSTPSTRASQNPRFQPPPGIEYSVSGDHVLMSSQRNRLVLIPLVLDNTCTIEEDRLPALPVTEDSRLSWIPYFETVTTAKSETTIIVTIVLPVADEKEAEAVRKTAQVRKSGNEEFEVSVGSGSQTTRWVFRKADDGYTLKD